MANIQSISHKKSSVIENGAPKLPTAAQLELGELAINFADGYETLSIKNNNNEIVTFTNDEYWVNKERVIAAALTDLDQRLTEVSEDVADIPEQVQADWNQTVTTAVDYIKNKPTISIDVVEDDTNAVSGGAVYDAISEASEVTAAALNDLDSRIDAIVIPDVPTTSQTVTENDTNPVSGGAVYSYITEIEQVTASALNDLDGRTTQLSDDVEDLADQISEISVELSSNYETSSDTGDDLDLEPGDDLDTLAGKLEKSIEETQRVTSYALNELSERIPNLELPNNYAPSSGSNNDLVLEARDTYEEAFGKLEKAIIDNELVTATALADLDNRITELSQEIPVLPNNIVTGASAAYTIWCGTQAEYNALQTYDNNTVYLIKETV